MHVCMHASIRNTPMCTACLYALDTAKFGACPTDESGPVRCTSRRFGPLDVNLKPTDQSRGGQV